MKIDNLQTIRSRFGNPDPERCSKCSHSLTIDSTEFFVTSLCENCFEHAEIREVDGCCSTPEHADVKYVIAGGAIQVRRQCLSCGWCSAASIGGVSSEKRNALPEMDQTKRDDFVTRKYSKRKEFLSRVADKRAELNKEHWFDKYSEYLKSPEWRQKRDSVLKRDNYLCQCCLNALATQVHHKSYEFVDMTGSEPAFDLVSICAPCHEKIETIKKSKNKTNAQNKNDQTGVLDR